MKLSKVHPFFYYARIEQKRLFRRFTDLFQREQLATHKEEATFLFPVKRHQSLLYRKLGSSDPVLQENKIVNLKIASKQINGIVIRPGEVFSFWHLVGRATKKKGYIEGMQLSRGEVRTGVGGGICQLANLLYWMALHTPFTITERHHHSFDPFPDEGRVLPFGSGASVFFNYVDLRFKNETPHTFQITVWLTDRHLKGAIFSKEKIAHSYHLEERNHRFLIMNGRNYRENEIWRKTYDRRTGEFLGEGLMIKNFSEVKYDLPENM